MKAIHSIYKKIFIILLIISSLPVFSQHIYISKESHIRFFSETPLENIIAVNKASNAVMNAQNNEIAIKIDIKRFEFPNKLMQEHFNENYMESDKYPYAIFKGKINKVIDWTMPQNTPVSVSGQMTLHGVQKMVILDGRLFFDPQSKSVILDANFNINLADYHINIPTILLTKIAEKIEVNAQFKLSPMINKVTEIATGKL